MTMAQLLALLQGEREMAPWFEVLDGRSRTP